MRYPLGRYPFHCVERTALVALAVAVVAVAMSEAIVVVAAVVVAEEFVVGLSSLGVFYSFADVSS